MAKQVVVAVELVVQELMELYRQLVEQVEQG
jgi:hypothetical protein